MKSNIQLQRLIHELKKQSNVENVNIWKRIALDLEQARSKSRIVNLYKLDKFTKENDTVIVPGKVLGVGEVNHKVTVAAFKLSDSARKKLEENKCTIYSIEELMKKNPKGSNVRILG